MEFEEAVEHILKVEGGYVLNPHDRGGETNFGISKLSYPTLDIKALTPSLAAEIYRRDYWDKIQVGALPPLLRLPVFDAAVNQGRSFAVGTLQAIVGGKVDGFMGPKTLAMIWACNADEILAKYMWRRLDTYASLSTWPRFGAGWAARLLSVALKNNAKG